MFVLSVLNVCWDRQLGLCRKVQFEGAACYSKEKWWLQGSQRHLSGKSACQESVSERHLAGTGCSLHAPSHLPQSNILPVVLPGANQIDRKQREDHYTADSVSWCKTLSDSSEIWTLRKEPCKHAPQFSWKRNRELYRGSACPVSDLPGTTYLPGATTELLVEPLVWHGPVRSFEKPKASRTTCPTSSPCWRTILWWWKSHTCCK